MKESNDSLQRCHCPACGENFIPWRVWQITRWTGVRCPQCNELLGRRTDTQAFAVGIMLMLLLQPIVFLELPVWLMTLNLSGALLVSWIIDAMTVKLVPLYPGK